MDEPMTHLVLPDTIVLGQGEPTRPGRASSSLSSAQHLQDVLRFTVGTFAVINVSGDDAFMSGGHASNDVTLTQIHPSEFHVDIYGLGPGGLLRAGGETALVRVRIDGVRLLLSYRGSQVGGRRKPNIVIRKLSGSPGSSATQYSLPSIKIRTSAVVGDVVVNLQGGRDICGKFGDWLKDESASQCIEGFSIALPNDLVTTDIMYKAILSATWESPWHFAGEYCGTRGIDFPICGVKIELSARAAAMYQLSYSALFLGGVVIGPIPPGKACVCADYRNMTGLRIELSKLLK